MVIKFCVEYIMLPCTFYKCVYSKYIVISHLTRLWMLFLFSPDTISLDATPGKVKAPLAVLSAYVDSQGLPGFSISHFLFQRTFRKKCIYCETILIVLLDNCLPFDLCYYLFMIFYRDSFSFTISNWHLKVIVICHKADVWRRNLSFFRTLHPLFGEHWSLDSSY